MDIVEKILGNRADTAWKARLEGATVDILELSQWDAQKNRLRKETEGGRTVAVSLERGASLSDGDILRYDENASEAVLCRIRLCPVMAVSMEGLRQLPPEEALRAAVRLGHALGNQHWPAVVKGDCVYVPMTADEKVMGAVMDTHAVPGTSYAFLAGEEVRRLLDREEVRLLFGGAEKAAGGHVHHHGVHA